MEAKKVLEFHKGKDPLSSLGLHPFEPIDYVPILGEALDILGVFHEYEPDDDEIVFSIMDEEVNSASLNAIRLVFGKNGEKDYWTCNMGFFSFKRSQRIKFNTPKYFIETIEGLKFDENIDSKLFRLKRTKEEIEEEINNIKNYIKENKDKLEKLLKAMKDD